MELSKILMLTGGVTMFVALAVIFIGLFMGRKSPEKLAEKEKKRRDKRGAKGRKQQDKDFAQWRKKAERKQRKKDKQESKRKYTLADLDNMSDAELAELYYEEYGFDEHMYTPFEDDDYPF